jgi:hypothetical protein
MTHEREVFMGATQAVMLKMLGLAQAKMFEMVGWTLVKMSEMVGMMWPVMLEMAEQWQTLMNKLGFMRSAKKHKYLQLSAVQRTGSMRSSGIDEKLILGLV